MKSPMHQPLLEAHADVAMVTIGDIVAMTRMGRSWLYAEIRNGRFPAPVVREPRCTRWKISHIREWLVQRAEKAQ